MRRITIGLLVVAAFHHITAAQAPVARELSTAWALPGRWTGVVGDEKSGAIYTLRYGRVAEVDAGGQIRREFALPPHGAATLRLGRFPDASLLTFTTWSTEVIAYDLSGNRLWSYPGRGIDDVWAGDVDGDGSDEVIVGYNGGTGVHVVDGNGRLRWKTTAIGNVWHVAVGNVLGQRSPQVVTTSAAGRVHIFSGDGMERRDVVTPRVYTSMIRAAKLRAQDNADTILVAGTNLDSKGDTVMALWGDGARKWRLEIPGKIHAAHVASSRPWLALGTRDGQVFVVDAVRGEIVGTVRGQGNTEVGWVGNPPVLLVATGWSLSAFHVNSK